MDLRAAGGRLRVWTDLHPALRLYFAAMSRGNPGRARAVCDVVMGERPVREVAREARLSESSLRTAAAAARRAFGPAMQAAGLSRTDLRVARAADSRAACG